MPALASRVFGIPFGLYQTHVLDVLQTSLSLQHPSRTALLAVDRITRQGWEDLLHRSDTLSQARQPADRCSGTAHHEQAEESIRRVCQWLPLSRHH